MKKQTVYLIILVIISLIFWRISLFLFAPKESSESFRADEGINNSIIKTMSEDKKILIVVAFDGFKDEEYFVPKEVFEQAGFIVETTSFKKGVARGVDGGEAIIEVEAEKIQAKDYEAVIFCGGGGMAEELDNKIFQKLAKDFYKEDKLVAAICVAPALLAKAGILEGKEATVWSSPLDKNYIQIIKENGGVYVDKPVVISGNVVTANGPDAAKDFGKTIVNQLGF
ncbi:MAG: DJ-1/PfpI family protein [Candidatus Pacebacteria bacterium]|nr:DJ-1/PfpI family protein [Candidatus Paceibacterota bacterium]